ncbi:Asp protease 2 domain containing protein [Trichuris trichiura]|uniref:Asp protease 2 domain containing protein n=1 Tax=Trichuris trichiura TaxID=36087 RepID=A0A077ZN88_TRITR|nr:Asp protease 2 domain containing protein [Trichuris trichiura]
MSADEVTGNGFSGIMSCVSLPRPFDEGNFGEWLLRFEICSSANNWNDEVKARRLPTLLKGEAFLAHQRLPDDVHRNYRRLTTELKNSLQPPGSARAAFVQFESMRWRTGESVRAFVHRLTQALDLAVPGLDTQLHRRQVLLQGEIDSVEQAIQKTQILLSFDEMPLMPAATVAVPANAPAQEKTVRDEDRWRTIDQRIDELTEQLSTLTMRPPEQPKGLQCYVRGKIGHFARNCRANRNERSLTHSVQNALSDRMRRSFGPTAHRVGRWRGPRRSTYRTEQVSASNSHFTSTIIDHSAKVNFQNNVCMISACINDYCCDVMIDTGSSVNLLSDRVVQALAKEDTVSGIPLIRLLNASSQPVTVKGEITLRMSVGKLAHPFKFIVVQNLVADAILGIDFLVKNSANVDLQKRCISSPCTGIVQFKQPAVQLMSKSNLCYVHSHCALLPHYEDSESVENDDRMEYEVPWFGNATKCELPVAPTIYNGLLGDFKSLFVAKPGRTNLAKLADTTEGNPVRVPPRRIPEQFRNILFINK